MLYYLHIMLCPDSMSGATYILCKMWCVKIQYLPCFTPATYGTALHRADNGMVGRPQNIIGQLNKSQTRRNTQEIIDYENLVELLKLILLLCTFDIEKGFILCFAKRLVRPNSVAKLRSVKLVLRLPTGEIISARSV